LIVESDIQSLVDLFARRKVSLYHACQFIDFESYLQLQGIPSRALLTRSDLQFTSFETDSSDKGKGVWDKVFLNLEDFGSAFALGRAAVPNPYGPILLRLGPSALREASDIAICLRSAGADDFDRNAESLPNTTEVDRLFRHPIGHSYPADLKHQAEIREAFGDPRARNPEISCTTDNGLISISHVNAAIVDDYIIDNSSFVGTVGRAREESGIKFPVWKRRNYKAGRENLLNEIAQILLKSESTGSLMELIRSDGSSDEIKEWAGQVQLRNLDWQYDRFADYLLRGSLLPLYWD